MKLIPYTCVTLTITFIALKLCGAISWSWLIVLSPVFAYLIILILLMALFGILVGIAMKGNGIKI